MNHLKLNRLLAFLLAACMIFGLGLSAQASSIQDGASTATMSLGHRETILETTAGTRLRACSYTYTTDNGLSGVAYCIDHGLDFTSKTLPITGKYMSSPKTAGVYANGYPSHSLYTFNQLFLADNPVLAGLTEYEYAYATQLAVWASLGQLGIAGTEFTDGREYIEQPSGDAQQERVFRAVQLLLWAGKRWDRVYQTGAYIRTDLDRLGGNISIDGDMTLEYAADNIIYGLKREVINGVSYYTREYYAASATSTYYDDYNIELWAEGAPTGTIFTYFDNTELPRGTFHEKQTWRAPSTHHYTDLNSNGYEYLAGFKLCIPTDTAPLSGEITIHMASLVMQYDIYLAENSDYTEQSYIIADPSQGVVEADAVLNWGSPLTEVGSLEVLKTDGNGLPLSGAKFVLTGTDGSSLTGTSDSAGKVRWDDLNPNITYTLTESEAPAGFGIAEPRNIRVKAARVNYETVTDSVSRRLTVHKQDKQNGYSLQGCTFRFEQIDGSFKIDKTTDHAGNIQLTAEQLPTGNYKIYEISTKDGYELDPTPQTVNWDGLHDITLTFENARKKTLVIYKCDEGNHYALPHATFDIFRNGSYVTSVTTNDAGLAYVTDVTTGYYTAKEKIAPAGYELSTEEYSVYVDNYDPATTDDPRLVVPNKALPTLRIVKLDRTTLRPMEGITFEVSCDGTSLGTFKTDSAGEIIVTDHAGTFLVKEVETADTHIVCSDPQQIELKAGDGTRTLYFFNDKKPGMHLVKLDEADLSTPIPNARFSFTAVDGSWGPQELTTGADGTIDLSRLPAKAFVVTELDCPGYVIDNAQRIIQLKPNENVEFVFTNSKDPALHLKKLSSDGTAMAGVSFRLAKIEDGSHYLDRTTNSSGEILWEGLEPGVYSLTETATLSTHILNTKEYHVELFPGKVSEIVIENDIRPNLTVYKHDADTGEAVPNTVFTVRAADGHSVDEIKTDNTGKAELKNLLPGVYEISEKSVPDSWLMDAEPQLVTLYPDRDHTAYFYNHRKPDLTVKKVSAITGEPLRAKFHVTYASDNTSGGEINDLGTYWTENGEFSLAGLKSGWVRIDELEPPTGYSLPEPSYQEFYIRPGQSKTVTFEDTPLSAIVIWKYDAVSGLPVQSTFQLRYLTDTSGTGGTVIGTYTTNASTGACTITNLKKGSYVVEEISTDSTHVISEAPQTVFLSGEDQDVVSVYFGNVPKGSLMVTKVASGGPNDGKPLSDVEFQVTTADGAYVGNNNGKFVTDSSGSFLVENQNPGTALIVRETRAKSGYLLDNAAQTAIIKPGVITNLEFRNQALGNLLIVKRSSLDNAPLEGVQFKITYADGSFVDNGGGTLSSNGIYYTDRLGQVKISGITGTVVVTEEKSVDGFSIDKNTRTQTVTVNPGDTQTLYFYNAPAGGVEIIKVNAADKSQRIPNTTFEIRRMDGGLVSTATTGTKGRVYRDLDAGDYYAVETEAGEGFKLDPTPTYFTVENGKTTTLTITNQPFSGILLHKYDATTNSGIYGASFLLYDTTMTPIGQYTSDQRGYAYIDGLTKEGRYYLKELDCPGYVVDTQFKTIYVKAGETTTIEWPNNPIVGQIQVLKKSADYNSVNGLPAGTPLEGTVFEIYNERTGVLVDTIVTGANGLAVSKQLPLARYTVHEAKASPNYLASVSDFSAVLEYSGQILRFEVADQSVSIGVAINKTGPREAVSGQPLRYVFSGISNTSNVTLNNFYWRDSIPTTASLDKVVTGTYNFPGTYKVVYRVNNGEDFYTLADNLSTARNYTLLATPAALGLAADQRITEIMFSFGQAPAGFAQVEAPTLYCTAAYGLTSGMEILNVADVGGVYNERWVQAVTRWLTTVYAKPVPLPRTGY